MPHYLSAHELGQTAPAELESFESPVPTQVVSNGEYNPLPQTREQRRVEARIKELADDLGPQTGLLDLAKYAKQNWNPALTGENDLTRFKFENYVREVFVDSDTKVALLSGAPFDDQTWDLLTNDQIAAGRAAINRIADSRRMLAHAVFTPKKNGWMGEVDRAIAELKPDSWKGYTIGDPLFPSKAGSYWRLDDTKLMYPV